MTGPSESVVFSGVEVLSGEVRGSWGLGDGVAYRRNGFFSFFLDFLFFLVSPSSVLYLDISLFLFFVVLSIVELLVVDNPL
jgi:hypothetical protein